MGHKGTCFALVFSSIYLFTQSCVSVFVLHLHFNGFAWDKVDLHGYMPTLACMEFIYLHGEYIVNYVHTQH